MNPLLYLPAHPCFRQTHSPPHTHKCAHRSQTIIQGRCSVDKGIGGWEASVHSWDFYSWMLGREETILGGVLLPPPGPLYCFAGRIYLVPMKQKGRVTHKHFSGALTHLKLWLLIDAFQMLPCVWEGGYHFSCPRFNKGANDGNSLWCRSSPAGRLNFPSSWHFRTERVSPFEALRESKI